MKQSGNITLFIATIAVVAPFMPDEIEVLAYKAYFYQTSKQSIT